MSSPEDPHLDAPSLSSVPQILIPPADDPSPPPVFASAPVPPEPTENPVWSGWDVLQIAGLTLFTLFIAQILIVLGARHFAFPHASWMEVAQKPSLALLAELLTYATIALYMILLVEGKYHTGFWRAIRWNWPGMAGVSLVGIGVLMLGFDLLGKFLPMPKSTPFDQFFATRSDALLTAVFAVTLGPLMEELFFRGFLYPVIARRAGIFWGILLTALPFGLIHFIQYGNSWGAVLIIFLVGVVLTAVRAKTKSVASSFLAHASYNGTLMLLAAWATDGFRHMEKAGLFLF